ncbi:MAG: AAA family ATPase [Nanoarchaeota archaeon]|nr:AAA family ATPase [Nanoarchaeota archaeon]
MKLKKSNNKNKLILILGAPVAGKSTISSLLAHKLGIRHIIDTDILRNVKAIHNPENKYINSFSFLCWKHFGKRPTKKAVLKGYKTYSQQVISELRGIININNSLGRTVIIEGVHLHPSLLKDVFKKENVYPIVINVDSTEHKRNIKLRVKASFNHDPKLYLDNFEAIRIINNYLLEYSQKNGFKVFQNSNMKTVINEIITAVSS